MLELRGSRAFVLVQDTSRWDSSGGPMLLGVLGILCQGRLTDGAGSHDAVERADAADEAGASDGASQLIRSVMRRWSPEGRRSILQSMPQLASELGACEA